MANDPATASPPSRVLSGRAVVIAVYLGLNIGLILHDAPFAHFARDWAVWEGLAGDLATGELYRNATELPYLLSPIAAPVMAIVGLIGPAASVALHAGFVLLLRDPMSILIVVAPWGFWTDMVGGNTLTYAFVCGVLALRGSRRWALGYFGLVMLAPRLVELPLAAWLLWTRPDLRVPAAALVVAHTTAAWLTGYLDEWIAALLALGIPEWSIGPSHWLGPAWLAIGVPASIALTVRGRPGFAGLMLSAYWVPQYFLMPLVDVLPRRMAGVRRPSGTVVAPNRAPK